MESNLSSKVQVYLRLEFHCCDGIDALEWVSGECLSFQPNVRSSANLATIAGADSTTWKRNSSKGPCQSKGTTLMEIS